MIGKIKTLPKNNFFDKNVALKLDDLPEFKQIKDDIDKKNKTSFAYNAYIKTSLSFILTKNKISAIKPQLVEPIIFDWDSHYIMYELGNSTNGRYSDLPDEVQVKDRIPFDRIKGMTIPIEYMVTEHIPEIKFKNYKYIPSYNSKELIEYLNRLKELLNQYKLSSDLYDLETQLLLDSEDTITELVNDVLVRKKN